MTIRIADLRALAEGFDPTPSKSWSLPARAYTRPEFQEADQEEAQDYWLANQIDGDPLAPPLVPLSRVGAGIREPWRRRWCPHGAVGPA